MIKCGIAMSKFGIIYFSFIPVVSRNFLPRRNPSSMSPVGRTMSISAEYFSDCVLHFRCASVVDRVREFWSSSPLSSTSADEDPLFWIIFTAIILIAPAIFWWSFSSSARRCPSVPSSSPKRRRKNLSVTFSPDDPEVIGYSVGGRSCSADQETGHGDTAGEDESNPVLSALRRTDSSSPVGIAAIPAPEPPPPGPRVVRIPTEVVRVPTELGRVVGADQDADHDFDRSDHLSVEELRRGLLLSRNGVVSTPCPSAINFSPRRPNVGPALGVGTSTSTENSRKEQSVSTSGGVEPSSNNFVCSHIMPQMIVPQAAPRKFSVAAPPPVPPKTDGMRRVLIPSARRDLDEDRRSSKGPRNSEHIARDLEIPISVRSSRVAGGPTPARSSGGPMPARSSASTGAPGRLSARSSGGGGTIGSAGGGGTMRAKAVPKRTKFTAGSGVLLGTTGRTRESGSGSGRRDIRMPD